MDVGKVIIIAGIVLVALGLLISFVPGLGKLPGDIFIKKGNASFYFPVVTSLLLSILLSILLNIFLRK